MEIWFLCKFWGDEKLLESAGEKPFLSDKREGINQNVIGDVSDRFSDPLSGSFKPLVFHIKLNFSIV